MRDIFLVLVFPILLYFILRRPYIGVSMWIWSSMFFPNGWVWGFAASFRYNMLIALATILSYIFQKDKIKTDASGLTTLILFFFFWSTISSFITISYSPVVWFEWNTFLKIIIFYVFCILTIKTKHHVNVFIWAITLSAAFFGAGEGLKYIVTGGGHVVEGIVGSRLSDRNELALALNMTIPLIIFLLPQVKSKLLKMALTGTLILNIVTIIGSFSRGGLLGLIIIGGYFFLQSKRKLLVSIIFFGGFIIASAMVSDKWTNRMDTINTMETDMSFLGRVMAWKQATLMAIDNPIFGGGFKAGQNQALWLLYEPEFSKLDFIVDTSGVRIEHAKAAHSIYFQVLGDLGFVGLFMFLAILLLTYRKLIWVTKNTDDEWIINLAKMLKVSLVAYCAGGAALSLPYFDLSFAIFALTHILCEIIKRENNKKVLLITEEKKIRRNNYA
ncbi:putative O-glycosylation ligase, exosortase A system-associated [Colwellia sp. 12G3]|uniref:putative O-glycosylation ligase, exosortase A system-associated n=1 Tax=Colwellia sp. 12G3 TaxID=2058299 RepID=UPI000C326A9B|nr:putative O-glycosylation ligase, exosortase A system-associated [Colwellia sp. 12G3]PKI15775.1 putative O-glycosylation ligase, exosortase A system-associated [Colwellia sp. 12G3]